MDLETCAQVVRNCQRAVDDFLLSRGPLKGLVDVSHALVDVTKTLDEHVRTERALKDSAVESEETSPA